MMARKREQKTDTIMELMNEKMMLYSWMALSSLMNLRATATMRKSSARRKKMRKE